MVAKSRSWDGVWNTVVVVVFAGVCEGLEVTRLKDSCWIRYEAMVSLPEQGGPIIAMSMFGARNWYHPAFIEGRIEMETATGH